MKRHYSVADIAMSALVLGAGALVPLAKSNPIMTVSMESNFVTNSSTATGTPMHSYYAHQISDGHFDWGSLSFSISYPYVSYETSIINWSPVYEPALHSYMSIDFSVDMPRC